MYLMTNLSAAVPPPAAAEDEEDEFGTVCCNSNSRAPEDADSIFCFRTQQ
jgi:hypothetical protein